MVSSQVRTREAGKNHDEYVAAKIEVMEKAGTGEVADQTSRRLMRLHVQKYKRLLAAVQREFAPFAQV
jgi:hypothetical protein